MGDNVHSNVLSTPWKYQSSYHIISVVDEDDNTEKYVGYT